MATILTAKEKSFLIRKNAQRILSGFGNVYNSFNISTTRGFSFNAFFGRNSGVDELKVLLASKGIKFTQVNNNYSIAINISTRRENLDKFVQLGEEVWEKCLATYLPMIDKLEEIQSKVDSTCVHKNVKGWTNYLVSRTCFADYLRDDLVNNERLHNIEEEIDVFSKLVKVQGDVDAVIALYKENRATLKSFSGRLAVLLDEEYERLTGKKDALSQVA